MARALPKLDARRFALSFLIAAALVGLWLAGTRAQTGPNGDGPKDPAIQSISPGPDELVLRQTQVIVDLAPGYRGALYIDGQQIPVTDLVNDSQPGQTPAPHIDAVFDPA